MFAVIKIKGHQYLIKQGERLKVDRIKGEQGAKVELKDIYLLFDANTFSLGRPIVAKAKVEARILRQFRGRKVIAFKYGPKDRYKKKRGFRPEYTELEITSLSS